MRKNYIISESQYALILEQFDIRLRRRLNYETLEKFIHDGEINFPTLCDDFGDEFEYADNVISWAADDFLTSNEDVFLDEMYDDVHDIVVDMCKDWFGEYLLDVYRNTCSEEE